MKKKLHIENVSGGAKISHSRSYGALKNLIFAGGGLVKRNGHKTVAKISSSDGVPLRINGIFDYVYIKNGESCACKIVHAGSHIFKLDAEFNFICELELIGEIIIKDERSRGFLRNGVLYIIGAGDILICDGESVKSAYFLDGSFVPITSRKITDRRSGMKCEAYQSPNLLNPRRKNMMIGSGTHKILNESNVFLLDSEIAYGKPFTIDVKIRTKTSEESDNDHTTSYIGINGAGEEVSTVVNLRYARENVDETVRFFLIEPMRNDRGEEIRIKIGDKIHDYTTVPFGVRIRNRRELCLGFDVCAPYPNEENIVIEYESRQNHKELLYDVDFGALASYKGGEELLVFTRGGNELYYSDPVEGFSYLPLDNKLKLGGQDKITSAIQLWDGVVGVFKENGFFRVRFGENGHEVVSSLDSLGAFSLYSTSVLGSDCLFLNSQGIFGVDDYKSSMRDLCLLSSRSFDIDNALLRYSRDEKREAVSIAHRGKYYLFIGNECFVGVCKSSSGREYDWYPWYGFGARVVCTLDGELYFGKENGEIRKMHSGYQDITVHEYSSETLSLILDNEGEATRFITDKTELEYDTTAKLGEHLLYIGKAKEHQDSISFVSGAPTYKDGSVKLFYGDTLILRRDGDEREKTVLCAMDKSVYFEHGLAAAISESTSYDYESEDDGDEWEVYQKKTAEFYEAELENGAIYLKKGGEAVKIHGASYILLEEKRKIQAEYKTAPLSIGTQDKNATLTKLYLNVYSGTEGEIDVEISTHTASYAKKITSAPAVDFERLDFNRMDFGFGLDKHLGVPFFVRGFDYLDVKITTDDEKPVYIGFLMLEYYKK